MSPMFPIVKHGRVASVATSGKSAIIGEQMEQLIAPIVRSAQLNSLLQLANGLTTMTGRKPMIPDILRSNMDFKSLTDSELSHELTEVRIALESISPYISRELTARRHLLWLEYDRRAQLKAECPREIARGIVEVTPGKYRCNI